MPCALPDSPAHLCVEPQIGLVQHLPQDRTLLLIICIKRHFRNGKCLNNFPIAIRKSLVKPLTSCHVVSGAISYHWCCTVSIHLLLLLLLHSWWDAVDGAWAVARKDVERSQVWTRSVHLDT